MRIDRFYLWDVDFAPEEMETEAFRNHYIEKVLQHGTLDDIREIGLDTIHRALPDLRLAREIREFWEWYFARHPEAPLTVEDPVGRAGDAPS